MLVAASVDLDSFGGFQRDKRTIYQYVHLVKHIVRCDEIVCDAYSVGFHWVSEAIGE